MDSRRLLHTEATSTLGRAGLLVEQRMYQLIRQQGPIVDGLFEIELLDRGAEAFVFTFG
jgi:hypothetical protein